METFIYGQIWSDVVPELDKSCWTSLPVCTRRCALWFCKQVDDYVAHLSESLQQDAIIHTWSYLCFWAREYVYKQPGLFSCLDSQICWMAIECCWMLWMCGYLVTVPTTKRARLDSPTLKQTKSSSADMRRVKQLTSWNCAALREAKQRLHQLFCLERSRSTQAVPTAVSKISPRQSWTPDLSWQYCLDRTIVQQDSARNSICLFRTVSSVSCSALFGSLRLYTIRHAVEMQPLA